MDPNLIDQEKLSLEAIWKQPSEHFFLPNDVQTAQERNEATQQLESVVAAEQSGQNSAVLITDDDADGLGAYVVLDSVYDEVAVIPSGPHGTLETSDSLSLITDHLTGDVDIWLTDIRLDPSDIDPVLTALRHLPESMPVTWIDHHIWDDDTRDQLAAAIDTLVIDTGETVPKTEERCASEITADYVEDELGATLSDTVREAIRVTSVYDCWKKNEDGEFIDPRAKDLGDYATIVETPDTYRELISSHGADIADNPSAQTALDNHRALNADLNELAVEEAHFVVVNETTDKIFGISEYNLDRLQNEGVDEGEWVIALTYGTCNQNIVADMLANRGADSVAIVKPNGGVSFRSRGEFAWCAQVAACFDGGGHETAAGAHVADGEFGIELDSMAAYGEHWTSHGQQARRAIRRAYNEVLSS